MGANTPCPHLESSLHSAGGCQLPRSFRRLPPLTARRLPPVLTPAAVSFRAASARLPQGCREQVSQGQPRGGRRSLNAAGGASERSRNPCIRARGVVARFGGFCGCTGGIVTPVGVLQVLRQGFQHLEALATHPTPAHPCKGIDILTE